MTPKTTSQKSNCARVIAVAHTVPEKYRRCRGTSSSLRCGSRWGWLYLVLSHSHADMMRVWRQRSGGGVRIVFLAGMWEVWFLCEMIFETWGAEAGLILD